MAADTPSPEYARFTALLSRIVTTPKAVVDARAREEADIKAWREKHDLKQKRQPKRRIVR